MKKALFLILAFTSSVLFSGTIDLKKAEIDLVSDFKTQKTSREVNPRIKKNFEKLLGIQESYEYPFDSLAQYVEIVQSKDKNLRIFSWDNNSEDLTLSQYKAGSGKVKTKWIETDGIITEIHDVNINSKPNYICFGRNYKIKPGQIFTSTITILELEKNELRVNNGVLDKKYSVINLRLPRSVNLTYDPEEKIISFNHISKDIKLEDIICDEYYRTKVIRLKLMNGKFTEYELFNEKSGLSKVFQPDEMIFVKGGVYEVVLINDPLSKSESSYRAKPYLENIMVSLKDFYISKYEITQDQYIKVIGVNPSSYKDYKNPVDCISIFEAVEFCNKLSEMADLAPCYTTDEIGFKCDFDANGYRLPTEAEWRYAASGGENGIKYKYSGSDNIDEVAVYKGNSNGKPQNIGTKKANELGIYDMSGNVAEWVWESFFAYTKPYHKKNNSGYDVRSPSQDSGTQCGGSSTADSTFCQIDMHKLEYYPQYGSIALGFRVVRTSKFKIE